MTALVRKTGGQTNALAAAPAESEIIERIYDAVVEQRLPPGTKLPEAALCQAFGVRRSRIRRSLLLLASRNIVVLHPNRGAFVSRPTAQEAKDVFEARRSVESDIARLAAERAEPGDLNRLEAHLGLEELAAREHDRSRSIRLSGDFHVLLARAGGNEVLHAMVKDLVARSSLIIAMYGSASENCRPGDHRDLLAALRNRDAAGAAGIMSEHLFHIESRLAIGRTPVDGIDLVALFSP